MSSVPSLYQRLMTPLDQRRLAELAQCLDEGFDPLPPSLFGRRNPVHPLPQEFLHLALSGAGALYSCRAYLVDDEYVDELQSTVTAVLQYIVAEQGVVGNEELVGEAIRILCGPAPLSCDELLRFLDAARVGVLGIIQSRCEARQQPPDTRSDHAASTLVTMSAKTSTVVNEAQRSKSRLDLFAANDAAGAALSKIAALKKLESQHPDRARVFQIIEFTGVTVEELARYIKQPAEAVMRDWRLALSQILEQEILSDAVQPE